MTDTHEIAREYAEPIEGLYPITEMLTVGMHLRRRDEHLLRRPGRNLKGAGR